MSEALVLFGRDGYEQTTMEAIAEAAEVSPSTLYRYFPTKDLVILDRFKSFSEEMVEEFARCAAGRPVEEALAEAIFASLRAQDERREETLLARSIIDKSPIPRARLWDYLYEQFDELERGLAEKLHLAEDDLRVVLTARLAMLMVGTAADMWRANGDSRSSRANAEEVMRLFNQGAVIFPRPPAAQ